jgi:RHS repeat-associated protein
VYDSRGRFTYDALGRRVSKTSGGTTTRWLWDGDVPVHEWTGGDDASELCTWIFEPESFAPLGKIASDGTSYSVVTDYLGTPTEMFDEAGKLAWRAQLDVYGVPHVAEGTAGDCPWRWPGQYEDQETGLYYNRFRYYDPERGTYLSADPLRLLGSLRLYGYPPDPLRAFDPLGLMPWAWNADDGMGHHLVPRGKANSIGLSDLGSDRNTPTFFPIPYDPGMHEALHRAQSPHVGPLQGPWHGTEASLLAASRAGLDDVSHLRGDLRIPATGQVLARNVTPAEAFDRMSAWHDEKQKEKASACG